MKPSNFFSFVKSSFLTFDLIFLTTAVTLLAEMNSVQTKTLQQSQLLTLQTPKLENADDKSGWLVLAAIAALGSFVGLSALKHKQYMALRRNDDLQSNVPEEDTYFG